MRTPALLPLVLAVGACNSGPEPDLRSADAYERYLGALDAARRGGPEAFAELDALRGDPDSLARTGLVVALAIGRPPDAPTRIAAMLSDPDAGVRAEACRALGSLADPQGMEPLLNALRTDEAVEVRRTAALALRAFESREEVRKALVAALGDAAAAVAYNAHESLRKLLGRDDVPRDRAACEAWIESELPKGS